MKQFLFLTVLTILGGIGALETPFWGVMLYYTLAVLRPQYLWEWALPVEVRWSMTAAIILIIAVLVNFSSIFKNSNLNRVVGLMMIYGMLLMFSVLTAFDPNVAQVWGVEYAKVMLVALLASLVINRLWQVRLLAFMIFVVLGYIAWETNYLYFFRGGRLDIFHHGYGGLDNNGAALMILMGLPFAYCFTLSGPGKWRKPLFFIGGFIGCCTIHSVMLTYSRGAMVAGIIGMAWILFHHKPRFQAAGIVVLLVIAINLMAGQQVRDRFESTLDYRNDTSAQSRLDSWKAAWDIAWSNPVFGKGIRNSNQYTHNYGADMQGRTIHNQYLQIAADSGIPAMVIYMTLLGTAIYSLGRTRQKCLRHLDHHKIQSDKQAYYELHQTEKICMAIQTSLIIFAVDGMLLSLEMFELPWLLIVLAGVLPSVLEQRIQEFQNPPAPVPKTPHRHRPHPAAAVRARPVPHIQPPSRQKAS